MSVASRLREQERHLKLHDGIVALVESGIPTPIVAKFLGIPLKVAYLRGYHTIEAFREWQRATLIQWLRNPTSHDDSWIKSDPATWVPLTFPEPAEIV